MNSTEQTLDESERKKILRLQVIVKELRNDINRALENKYGIIRRLDDIEREIAELRKAIGILKQKVDDLLGEKEMAKTSGHDPDENNMDLTVGHA